MCGYIYANTGVFRGVRSPGSRRGRWKSNLCLLPGLLAFSATEPSLQPQSLNFNIGHLSLQNCEEYSSVLSNLPSETFCYSSKNGLKFPGLDLCEYVTIERVQGIFFFLGAGGDRTILYLEYEILTQIYKCFKSFRTVCFYFFPKVHFSIQ